jgi:hypothetical protein
LPELFVVFSSFSVEPFDTFDLGGPRMMEPDNEIL